MNNSKDKSVWIRKQEWCQKVLASDLSPATKVFAMVIFNRCYGDKTVCHPGHDAITRDGGWKSHQALTQPRKNLVQSGAISAELRKGNGTNYVYTLNLDWNPQHGVAGGTSNVLLQDPQPVVAGTRNVVLQDQQRGVAGIYQRTTKGELPNEDTSSVADAPERDDSEMSDSEETGNILHFPESPTGGAGEARNSGTTRTPKPAAFPEPHSTEHQTATHHPQQHVAGWSQSDEAALSSW